MKCTQEVSNAIGKASEKIGNNTEIGKLVGVSGATVGKWRNGKVAYISEDVWENLLPYIRPFLLTYHDAAPANSIPFDTKALPPECIDLCARWHETTKEERDLLQVTHRVILKAMSDRRSNGAASA